MGVLEPVKMTITNLPDKVVFDAPLQPKNPARGNYQVKLASTIWVDRKDIKDSEKE